MSSRPASARTSSAQGRPDDFGYSKFDQIEDSSDNESEAQHLGGGCCPCPSCQSHGDFSYGDQNDDTEEENHDDYEEEEPSVAGRDEPSPSSGLQAGHPSARALPGTNTSRTPSNTATLAAVDRQAVHKRSATRTAANGLQNGDGSDDEMPALMEDPDDSDEEIPSSTRTGETFSAAAGRRPRLPPRRKGIRPFRRPADAMPQPAAGASSIRQPPSFAPGGAVAAGNDSDSDEIPGLSADEDDIPGLSGDEGGAATTSSPAPLPRPTPRANTASAASPVRTAASRDAMADHESDDDMPGLSEREDDDVPGIGEDDGTRGVRSGGVRHSSGGDDVMPGMGSSDDDRESAASVGSMPRLEPDDEDEYEETHYTQGEWASEENVFEGGDPQYYKNWDRPINPAESIRKHQQHLAQRAKEVEEERKKALAEKEAEAARNMAELIAQEEAAKAAAAAKKAAKKKKKKEKKTGAKAADDGPSSSGRQGSSSAAAAAAHIVGKGKAKAVAQDAEPSQEGGRRVVDADLGVAAGTDSAGRGEQKVSLHAESAGQGSSSNVGGKGRSGISSSDLAGRDRRGIRTAAGGSEQAVPIIEVEDDSEEEHEDGYVDSAFKSATPFSLLDEAADAAAAAAAGPMRPMRPAAPPPPRPQQNVVWRELDRAVQRRSAGDLDEAIAKAMDWLQRDGASPAHSTIAFQVRVKLGDAQKMRQGMQQHRAPPSPILQPPFVPLPGAGPRPAAHSGPGLPAARPPAGVPPQPRAMPFQPPHGGRGQPAAAYGRGFGAGPAPLAGRGGRLLPPAPAPGLADNGFPAEFAHMFPFSAAPPGQQQRPPLAVPAYRPVASPPPYNPNAGAYGRGRGRAAPGGRGVAAPHPRGAWSGRGPSGAAQQPGAGPHLRAPPPPPKIQASEPWEVDSGSFVMPMPYDAKPAAEVVVADDDECVVCCDAHRSMIFAPCGHCVTCGSCADQVRARDDRCPLCREPITAMVQAKFT